MNRSQLEHVIRAAASITGSDNLVVFGSQAILANDTNVPDDLLVSMEADICDMSSEENTDLIDGTLGEASPFHQSFGYYAHGVSIAAAVLPDGWRERLRPITGPGTPGVRAWGLDAADVAVSKLIAGREKDLKYVETMVSSGLVALSTLRERCSKTSLPPDLREAVEHQVDRMERR